MLDLLKKLMLALALSAIAMLGGAAVASAATGSGSSYYSSAPSGPGAPTIAHGATVALIVAPTEAMTKPGAGRRKVLVQTYTSMSGMPQTLLVLGSQTVHGVLWVRVLLPIRPDGSSGWIDSNDVEISTTRYWIHVTLATRRVSVYRKGQLVESFRAVIGKPLTPTPTGLTAIYEIDRQPSPNDFLGSWAMPLVLFSNKLKSFDGGPGQVAIHGRGGTSLENPLGSAASHGCIRVANRSIDWLATHVPVGTPVQITVH